MQRFALLAATALLAAGSVHAQTPAASPLYGEVGYTSLKLSAADVSHKPGMLRGIVGYEFHPNLAVEGMLGVGAKDSSANLNVPFGVTETVKVKAIYGVFLKPKAEVTEDLEVFARVGYTQTELDWRYTAGIASESERDGSVSYGIGASYRITPRVYLGVDYANYYKKDGFKIDGVTLSAGMRF